MTGMKMKAERMRRESSDASACMPRKGSDVGICAVAPSASALLFIGLVSTLSGLVIMNPGEYPA